MERDEAADPADIRLLGAVAVVAIADSLAHGVEEGARCACGLSSGCCRCRAATLRFGRPMVRAVHTGASVLHRSHFPCAIRHLPLTPSDYAA